MPKVALITNCTSSASIPVIPYLDGNTLGSGYTHVSAATEWEKRVRRSEVENLEGRCPTRQMYTGISFRTVLQALDALGSDSQLFICSLGFGLVKAEDVISSYNLNIQPPGESPSSLFNIVTGEPFEPIRWWGAVNKALHAQETPLGKMIASKEYDMIIVALTNSFLNLVSADIASAIAVDGFRNVRVVGPKGNNWLQKYMRHIAKRGIIMPYGTHLNDLIPGNRNDFSQRCALHFIKEVLVPTNFGGALEEHRKQVADLMKIGIRGNGSGNGDDEGEHIPLPDVIATLKEQGIESITEAYEKASAMGAIVKFDQFQRMWGLQDDTAPADDELEDALAALQGISIGKPLDNQLEVVNTLKMFVKVLKANGGGIFTTSDLKDWAKLYFDRRKQEIPNTFSSPVKLGRILSDMCDDLQLVKHINAIGGKSYEVRP